MVETVEHEDRLLARLERVLKRLPRRQVLPRIGVSQATFTRWRNKQARPTGLSRLRLESALDWAERKIGDEVW